MTSPSKGVTLVACFDTRGYQYTGGDYRFPCNATAVNNGQHSSCCGSNDMCLSNGLCKERGKEHEGNNLYWSNGCTDSNFNDPACPRYCMEPDERNATNALVRYCPSTKDWCCASGPGRSDDDCCDEDGRRFKARDQVPAPSGIYATISAPTDVITSTRTLRAVSPTPTPSGSTSTTTSSSSSSSPPTGSPSPTESSTAALGSSGSNSELKIGLGVGLSLAFVAMIAIAIVLFLNRKRKKNARAVEVFPWTRGDRKHVYSDANEPEGEPSLAEMSGEGVTQEVAATPVEATPREPVELGDTGRR